MPLRARHLLTLLGTAMTILTIVGCADAPRPPRAAKRPHLLEAHGQERVDEYYWLRERENPAVLAYLEAENAYLDQVMAPTAGLQESLFKEIVGRIKKDDASVPVLERGYWHYTRYVAGGEYALHCRRQGSLDAPEQVMFDGNAMAAGHGYFSLAGVRVSSDNLTAAFAVDTVGRRQYTLRFRDLATGQDHPEAVANVSPGGVWAEDGQTFFYTRKDPETLRSYQVWRHGLGTDAAADVLVFEEVDETFNISVAKSRSRDFLFIHSSQTISDEVRALPSDQPDGAWRVLQPRERGLEYSVDHFDGRFFVRTNLEAQNFRLMECPEAAGDRASWRELVPHRDDVYLADFQLFNDDLVLAERRDGLMHLRVSRGRRRREHDIVFDEPTYDAGLVTTPSWTPRWCASTTAR